MNGFLGRDCLWHWWVRQNDWARKKGCWRDLLGPFGVGAQKKEWSWAQRKVWPQPQQVVCSKPGIRLGARVGRQEEQLKIASLVSWLSASEILGGDWLWHWHVRQRKQNVYLGIVFHFLLLPWLLRESAVRVSSFLCTVTFHSPVSSVRKWFESALWWLLPHWCIFTWVLIDLPSRGGTHTHRPFWTVTVHSYLEEDSWPVLLPSQLWADPTNTISVRRPKYLCAILPSAWSFKDYGIQYQIFIIKLQESATLFPTTNLMKLNQGKTEFEAWRIRRNKVQVLPTELEIR